MEISELENAYYTFIKELKEGEVIKGKIISVGEKEVIVDVGYKSEGIILREEFKGVDIENLKEVEVYVDEVEDEEGKIVLSYKKAIEVKGWQKLLSEYREGDLVKGTISRRVKGGYMVNVFGVEGFLPQSLSTFRGKEDMVGEEFYFQIIKLSKSKNNFILSRKDAIKKEQELAKERLWNSLEVGKVIKGKVKSITNFGAFVDLGGVDGLLHIADMSWRKISHPSEVVAVGDEVQVKILSFDRERGKISLGLKQMVPDPWQEIEKKYPIGTAVKGKVVNVQNYGIFLEIEKGIEGLVHISEVSWTKRFINLAEIFAIGDVVEAKVIGIDIKERKISLSIKQLEKDPWQDIENVLSIGSKVRGKIIGFGEGCAYVELESGFEGVIYNEDISWTKRTVKVYEFFKKAHTYEFKVLGLDKANRRVILGVKQLTPDPWPQILEKYPIGKVIEAEVVKKANFGIFVKLEENLEGLIFAGEIDKELAESLKPQDKVRVKIIKVEPRTAKIGLSAKI